MSTEGQKVVADNGYIPVADTKAYDGTKPSGSGSRRIFFCITGYGETDRGIQSSENPNAEIELQTTDSTTGMTSANRRKL